ncbi:hypothetical protein AAAT68_15490 [Lawsonibacter asaccharolyticus]
MNKLPTVPEMSDALARHKGRDGYTQKIYKAQADQHKGNQLSEDINTHIEKLKESESRGRIDFSDLEMVKDRTFQYLLACSEAQIYPSVMGLATFGFGISRQALNRWLSRNIESEAAQFILEVKDVMADVLTNAALYRNADAAMAIFQLKNHFEHADAVQIEIPQEAGPLGQKMDQRDLERRISESVVLDE